MPTAWIDSTTALSVLPYAQLSQDVYNNNHTLDPALGINRIADWQQIFRRGLSNTQPWCGGYRRRSSSPRPSPDYEGKQGRHYSPQNAAQHTLSRARSYRARSTQFDESDSLDEDQPPKTASENVDSPLVSTTLVAKNHALQMRPSPQGAPIEAIT